MDTSLNPSKSTPEQAITFLQHLRPNGPWALTAILPDGPTITITAQTVEAARKFIAEHNGKRNLYFAVNPLRFSRSKKATKADVASIEFLLGDFDPNDNETPEQAKERYTAALKAEPETNALVDSGNGLQGLWRLATPIPLPLLVDGKLSSEAELIIKDVEARSAALMQRLGAKAGTQNIDRILRLPGTVNLPNKKKRAAGRVPCEARVLKLNGAVYPLDAFSPATGKSTSPKDNAQIAGDDGVNIDELERTIKDGGDNRHGDTRSEAVYFVVNAMLRRGYSRDHIVKVLLDQENRISEHIYDQDKPAVYAKRQVTQAIRDSKLAAGEDGKPFKTISNICIALVKLGVTVRYDRFADRTLIDGLPEFGPALDDAAMTRLHLVMDRQFRFMPTKEMLDSVVSDAARLNSFHPVRDYLDGLQWDGVTRIDNWLTTCGGAEDNVYTRAVGALMLIAAVRRVRQPGCKFDEMVVFEHETQGTDKSSAFQVLAVREDWFSDDMPLSAEGKRIIESLRGRWIIEAAELSGMRRADIEHVKALLSRRIDRARLAFDRLVTEAPRQCIFVGTTNSSQYLRDQTGNRRFWPVSVLGFDIDALKRDRDQLWAEAAAREAAGESIRLKRELWPIAAEEQAQRLTLDPYVVTLGHHLNGFAPGKDGQGWKIAAEAVWEILNVQPGQRTQDMNCRVGEAMRALGRKRPNKSGIISLDGRKVSGYVRGEPEWKNIRVLRTPNGRLSVAEEAMFCGLDANEWADLRAEDLIG